MIKFAAFLTAILVALLIIPFLTTIISQVAPRQEWVSQIKQRPDTEETASVIGDVKTIYIEVYNPVTNEVREPYLLKTNPEDIYQTAILFFDRFNRLEKGLYFLAPGQNPKDLPETLWQQIGVPKKHGDILFWYTGRIAAQAMFELAKNPPKTNGAERVAPFIDKADIMAYVQIILAEINVSPDEIGATDEQIKNIALADLSQQIKKVRQDIKAKRLNKKNGLRAILLLAKRGIDGWYFSPRQLGLMEKEIFLLLPKKGRMQI